MDVAGAQVAGDFVQAGGALVERFDIGGVEDALRPGGAGVAGGEEDGIGFVVFGGAEVGREG